MGSIQALLENIPEPSRKGPPCTVCSLYDGLTGPEAQALNDLLGNPLVKYSDIAAGLRAEGVGDFEPRTLARHARGQCWEMRRQGRRLR